MQRRHLGSNISAQETCSLISHDALFSGAIFTEDQKDSSAELAFKYAVYRINKDRHILPRTTLVYDIQYVPRDDSFHASKKGRPSQICLHVPNYTFLL
jgi:hypothetical protein